MVKSFDKYPPSFQTSHFGYYFVLSWLRFEHTEYKGALTNKIFIKKE